MLLPRADKKMIFKISGKLSGNAFIQTSSKIYHSANIRRLIVFLSCYIMHITCRDMLWKICSRNFHGQNYDFTFFSPKYTIIAYLFTFRATIECCSNKLYQKTTRLHYNQIYQNFVSPEKKTQIKMMRFLNVLSVF